MPGATGDGELSSLGRSAIPESFSSEKCWSGSTKTILGRAFHGVKRVNVDERGSSNGTGQAIDEPSQFVARARSFASDAVGVVRSAPVVLNSPNKSTTVTARMANIPFPLMTRIDEARVLADRIARKLIESSFSRPTLDQEESSDISSPNFKATIRYTITNSG